MSEFDWSVDSIENLENKVIIVTGGNTGLGFEAAQIFANHHATVVLACKSVERAKAAKKKILENKDTGTIDIIPLDLGDLASIKAFVKAYKTKYSRLDVLLNNAGIMVTPYQLTKDGFESQTGINHLGHFALTALLFDLIKKTPNSRIVNVSSSAHKMAKIDFQNYLFENGGYGKFKAYGRSKLSNLLFTYELSRRVADKKLNITILAAHPGVAKTELGRHMRQGGILKPIYWIFNKVTQTAYQGALPEIRAALDPNAQSGEYYGPKKAAGKEMKPAVVESSKRSHNLEDANKLWVLSEKLTNVKFDI